MKVLVFDNYDSFTYNLVQIVEQILGEKVDVFRNDEIPLEDINQYDKIILSPGPGIPEEAGILLEVIKNMLQNLFSSLSWSTSDCRSFWWKSH